MAHDEFLAARFRIRLEGLPGITEIRMMGGICFMLSGNMIGGVHRENTGASRFMFRVGKDSQAEALSRPGARAMQMGGHTMSGFVLVVEKACDGEVLAGWVLLALCFVTTLVPKQPKRKNDENSRIYR